MTTHRAKLALRQAVGGELPPHLDIDEFSLINEAGHFMTTMHQWSWLEGGEVRLDLRANITVTGVTTSVTTANTLNVVCGASQFTDYTFLEGDHLEITGGGNLNKGFYRISKIVDDTTIALEDSPLTDTSAAGTSLTGTLHASACALPLDFREITGLYAERDTNNHVELTTLQDLIEKRSINATSPGTYYAAISHSMDIGNEEGEAGPRARLELWPTPSASRVGGLAMFYRAGWQTSTWDNNLLRMPGYCETLYLEILGAYGRSRALHTDLSADLARVMAGPIFITAMERDTTTQPDYGRLRNGAADSFAIGGGRHWINENQGAPTPPKHLR